MGASHAACSVGCWGGAGCGWQAGGFGLAGPGVLARWYLGLGSSGRFGVVGWMSRQSVGRWAFLVFVRAFSDVFTFDPGP